MNDQKFIQINKHDWVLYLNTDSISWVSKVYDGSPDSDNWRYDVDVPFPINSRFLNVSRKDIQKVEFHCVNDIIKYDNL